MTVRSVSYGGGVQSTALLVLAAQKRIDFDLFLFSNVGDDSEHPDSLAYVREVAMPYAAANGIELLELCRVPTRGVAARLCFPSRTLAEGAEIVSDGVGVCPGCRQTFTLEDGSFPAHNQPETLMGRLTRPGSLSLPIPVRMSNGAPGTRSCTADFKIRVIGKELKRRGATVADPATVALGISVDEIERAKPGIDPQAPYQFRVYPLLDLGLSRGGCAQVIRDAGLPVPGKSACFFCPFHDGETWVRLLRNRPDLFAKACELEDTLNERRAVLGKVKVWLTRKARPLAEVVTDDQQVLDGMDGCDSGWCMT